MIKPKLNPKALLDPLFWLGVVLGLILLAMALTAIGMMGMAVWSLVR